MRLNNKWQKRGKNRESARQKLARQHLRVSRQRKDWLCKLASALVASLEGLHGIYTYPESYEISVLFHPDWDMFDLLDTASGK